MYTLYYILNFRIEIVKCKNLPELKTTAKRIINAGGGIVRVQNCFGELVSLEV